MKRNDLVGKRFGLLTVIKYETTKKTRAHWACQCECGNLTVVSSCNLRIGAAHPVRSCGCLRKAAAAKMGRNARKHGEAIQRTPEYTAWRNIRIRCYNPNASNRKYYSELGVTVCERWRNSFEAFLQDVGRRPSDNHSLDRYPDPAGNYEPGNVRWATALEQRHNWRKSTTKEINHV